MAKVKFVCIRKYDANKGKFLVVARKFMDEEQLLVETSKPSVCDVFVSNAYESKIYLNGKPRPDVIVYHR